MTRTLRPAAAFALALLAGCTPMQWIKAEAAPGELDRDAIQCQQDAWREARLRSWYFRPMGPSAIRDATGRVIPLFPAGSLYDPTGETFMEESRLTQLCMREKGYELAPVEEKPAPEKPAQAETIQPSPSGTSAGRP